MMVDTIPELFDDSVKVAFIRPHEGDAHAALEAVALPAQLANASLKRRREFRAGRVAAADALAALCPDLAAATVAIGIDGEPIWPEGVVGSITHTSGLAAAAVANVSDVLALGLDAQQRIPDARIAAVLDQVCVEDEVDWARSAADLTLVFSAKECLFKCLYPLARQYIDFTDARLVEVSPRARRFRIQLRVDVDNALPSGCSIEGRFALHDRLTLTGIALPVNSRLFRRTR